MDRVETTGSVWLGLTLTCARCHDHKYDNLSQDEYYQIFAFYNNGDETNHNVPKAGADKEKLERDKAAHAKQVAELDNKLKALIASRKDAQAKWEKDTKARLAAIKNPVAHHPLKLGPLPKQDGYQFVPREDGSIFVEKLIPDTATFLFDFSADTGSKPLTGFRVEALSDPKLPSKGPGLTGHGNFVLNEFRVFTIDLVDPDKRTPLAFASAKADFSQSK
jgi:hypothetical protein